MEVAVFYNVIHSYNVMVSFACLSFTSYCSLFLVISKLHLICG